MKSKATFVSYFGRKNLDYGSDVYVSKDGESIMFFNTTLELACWGDGQYYNFTKAKKTINKYWIKLGANACL